MKPFHGMHLVSLACSLRWPDAREMDVLAKVVAPILAEEALLAGHARLNCDTIACIRPSMNDELCENSIASHGPKRDGRLPTDPVGDHRRPRHTQAPRPQPRGPTHTRSRRRVVRCGRHTTNACRSYHTQGACQPTLCPAKGKMPYPQIPVTLTCSSTSPLPGAWTAFSISLIVFSGETCSARFGWFVRIRDRVAEEGPPLFMAAANGVDDACGGLC
jgi:hypothetical protein